MEGTGNDYIYIDNMTRDVSLTKEMIIRMCDRHFGIGSDGVILLEPGDTQAFKMVMYNADGSRGKMCGNGIRCLAKFAYDHYYTSNHVITFDTAAGVRTVELLFKDGQVAGGIVDMGIPDFYTSSLPMIFDETLCINRTIDINGQFYCGTAVSMGNPHFVMVTDTMVDDVTTAGTILNESSLFPEGVNVEFVTVEDEHHFSMRVYERGSGETYACGTGACAAFAALNALGLVSEYARAKLLGGYLEIRMKDNGHLSMSGEARTVFKGDYRDE